MHDLGYVHRDLKPANIMMGMGKKENIVYLIDFGLTKKLGAMGMSYPGTGQISRKMAGTPIYSSINAHLATGEYFKKDDIESMMYVLVQLAKGSLPWQSIRAQNQEDYRELMLQKASIPPSVLCKDLPVEFAKVLEYVLNLENGNEVDYTYVECLFIKAADRNGLALEGPFDWYDLKLREQEIQAKKLEKQKSQEPSLNFRNFRDLISQENQNKSDISLNQRE
jgi:serine/threonine protein kinase